MARFNAEIPQDILGAFSSLDENAEKMIEEMVGAGADVVHNLIQKNMKKSFETTESLEKGLKLTKVYRTPSDDGVNVHIGFYGYNDEGVPIDLIAQAREHGTSRGEQKKPFLRKSFKKKDIEAAMNEVQSKYIKDSD